MSAREPDLPKDPAEYRPKPLMGLGFWALMAFGILCVLAGAGVAVLTPRFFPGRAPDLAPPPQSAPGVAVAGTLALPVQANAASSPSLPAELVRLNARIAALETQGARSSEAAAAAVAAAELVDASRGSRPFGRELAALRAAAPDLPELLALTRLAEIGAPSPAALAVSFPDYAARAASRARKPPEGAGLGERLAYAAGKVVTIRRVDEVSGESADAVLARAELALAEGDVVAALKLLDRLPPKSRHALEPWRADAERRAEIDRQVAALRSRAMRDLAPGAPAA